jgi:hypothetical protein
VIVDTVSTARLGFHNNALVGYIGLMLNGPPASRVKAGSKCRKTFVKKK